jgi:hypothetical protein
MPRSQGPSGAESQKVEVSRSIRSWLVVAALGGLAGSAVYVWLLMRQSSSTAGIGIFMLPIVFVRAAAVTAVLGLCLRQVAQAIRRPAIGSLVRAAIALVLLIVAGTFCARIAIQFVRLQQLQSDATAPATLMAAVEPALARRDYLELAAIAGNERTPAAALMELAASPDPGLHRKREGLVQLLDGDALAVVRKALRNPNLPPEAISLIARSDDVYVLGDVAMNPATPVPLLRELAERYDSYLIRWGLAFNPSTPDDILESLASGENADDRTLQRQLAQNEAAPGSVLARLATHADPSVRRAVARNPATPVASLLQLVEDAVEEVRFYLAINEARHVGVLEALMSDSSERVRRFARERLAQRAP